MERAALPGGIEGIEQPVLLGRGQIRRQSVNSGLGGGLGVVQSSKSLNALAPVLGRVHRCCGRVKLTA